MLMTLDVLSGIHSLVDFGDVTASTDLLARKGPRFKSIGPVVLLALAGLGIWWFKRSR